MISNKVQAVVLAAGKSTRFKTGRTKLLEKICGQEMILYSTRLLEALDIPTIMVVGYQKDAVIEQIQQRHQEFITFVVQEQQRGTGHAVQCAMQHLNLDPNRDLILIMNGDMPLATPDIISKLYEQHKSTGAELTFVTSHCEDTHSGYGRVITTERGLKIVEAKDFTGDASEHCWINAGIYLVNRRFLQEQITAIEKSEKTEEFYLTALIEIACNKGLTVSTITAPFDIVRGINNFQELWAAEQVKRAELIRYWMEHGVHFSVAHNVHIDLDVAIGSGSYIGCGVHLLGRTKIGKNCKINEFSSLENVTLGDYTEILSHSMVSSSTLGSNVMVGPYAHIRDNSHIGDGAYIGNFVEVTRSTIGAGTKAKHLAYLGDAEIGTAVNIGAGTVTCNYNGNTKNKTYIGDRAFIGSNNTLVAPVTIAKNAYTAAGSVITENVPEHALAIARARQVNKDNYATQLRTPAQPQIANITFVAAQKNKLSTDHL